MEEEKTNKIPETKELKLRCDHFIKVANGEKEENIMVGRMQQTQEKYQ